MPAINPVGMKKHFFSIPMTVNFLSPSPKSRAMQGVFTPVVPPKTSGCPANGQPVRRHERDRTEVNRSANRGKSIRGFWATAGSIGEFRLEGSEGFSRPAVLATITRFVAGNSVKSVVIGVGIG